MDTSSSSNNGAPLNPAPAPASDERIPNQDSVDVFRTTLPRPKPDVLPAPRPPLSSEHHGVETMPAPASSDRHRDATPPRAISPALQVPSPPVALTLDAKKVVGASADAHGAMDVGASPIPTLDVTSAMPRAAVAQMEPTPAPAEVQRSVDSPPVAPAPPEPKPASPGIQGSPREIDVAMRDATPSRAPSPPPAGAPSESQTSAGLSFGRQLNVTDALSYLDAVKQQFQDKPDVYNHFLDIMKDFKSQIIDTPGVIERVSTLFSGHPILIQGFNTFLPVGYRIECSVDAHDANLITVTTPTGTTTQTTGGRTVMSSYVMPLPPPTQPIAPSLLSAALPSSALLDQPANGVQYTQEQITPAIAYVTKIKQRFADKTDLYQEFLDILNLYKRGSSADEAQLATRIAKLFSNAPDLLSDFQVFMPQGILPSAEVFGVFDESPEKDDKLEKAGKKKPDGGAAPAAGSSVAQKRKRKPAEKEKPREIVSKAGPNKVKKPKLQHTLIQAEPVYPHYHPPSPPRHGHAQLPPQQQQQIPSQQPPALSSQSDAHFFERVRRALDNRDTYNEFLKLLNLFTQEIIDMRKLVEQSYSFLGEGELMAQFKDILGWDARWEAERFISASMDPFARGSAGWDRQSRADMSVRNGPSYRRLPASERDVACAGRDEMCRSVLNDEWVSHPTWASEDAGFVAHRKNAYEEALHRSEEERHEYDFHIEAIVRTIAMLEPINNKMAGMPPEERAAYKLKPNFSNSSKSIHQRIIKKIYGRDAGLEVIGAMHECPSVAVPVVLTRLKQKEEEWRRAQREWNKVWREVDARNFQKALDHQGITFKASDKKATTAKAFVSQIEAAREEQMARRASLMDPLFARTRPRHQMAFVVEDVSVVQDVLKLTFSFLDRMQQSMGLAERRRIEGFLRAFVPMFFMLDGAGFNAAFVARGDAGEGDAGVGEDVGSGAEEGEDTGASAGGARTGRNGRRSNGSDLRKKLLKGHAQDKASNRRTRTGQSSAPGSRRASPTETMAVDERAAEATCAAPPGEAPSRPARRGIFFSNAAMYSILRLIELLHARLLLCKSLGAALAREEAEVGEEGEGPSVTSASGSTTAAALALVDAPAPDGGRAHPAAHFYAYLLDACERLFDGALDQGTFEEVARHMFGTKAYVVFTVDKVVGALVKQVQVVLGDARAERLLESLKRERELVQPTGEDVAALRASAVQVMGPDEHVFRIDWLPEAATMTVQLLGKDDARFEDTEVVTGRWQEYIDSFVSDQRTNGLGPATVKPPFLQRNLKRVSVEMPAAGVHARSGLEIKVCVRTYRLFFVSHTEDVLWKDRGAGADGEGVCAARVAAGRRWLARFDDTGALG